MLIQPILVVVAFSKKTSRACTGMLSHGNDAFKFSKTAKNTNSTLFIIVPGLVELFCLPLTRNLNVKVAIELYHIFSKL